MFEYKSETINPLKEKDAKIEDRLNALGLEGWELVSMVQAFDGIYIVKAVLKRPLKQGA